MYHTFALSLLRHSPFLIIITLLPILLMCRYCTAPGGSNGKVGPFVGQVTQEFLNEVDFINAVELFGLVRIVRFIADIC